MAKLVNCPSCGGLIPLELRCCPHCHCRYSRWKRLVLLASAALGIAASSSCQTPQVLYGPAPHRDAGTPHPRSPSPSPSKD